VRLADGSLRTMSDACRQSPDWAATRVWDLPPVDPEDGEDFETYLRRIGFDDVRLSYVQRGFAGAAGEAMRNLDAGVAVEALRDHSTGRNDWRILDGYNRLHESWASGLDIRLNTVVERIEWDAEGVRVFAADGQPFEADRAVITLPLGVLRSNRVTFSPELPAEKREAIDRLRVAPVIKLVYRFAAPVLPEGVMALYSALNPCMWWSPSVGQPTGEYVLTAFVTADRARELLALSEAGALERGVETLRAELGRPDLKPVEARMVNWVDDPYALGGYSVTPPGAREAHEALARPVSNRLFWAGEATAGPLWKATVHGAYASGCRAAAEILSALKENEEYKRSVIS